MKQQIRRAKAKLTKVEMTPFPVWKKLYYVVMATIGGLWVASKLLSLIFGAR